MLTSNSNELVWNDWIGKDVKLARNTWDRLVPALVAGLVIGTLLFATPELEAEIDEIIVTARKRSESMQDTSVTVQVMEELDLDDQRIDSFADYVLYLPSISSGGRGPGQNEVYIRGAAVDAINISVAEAQGSAPNVALYLDEQPVTAGGRNLDVYVTDISRIEVLPGPQGTLYGSSSQAGTVRLITNKPVLNEFEMAFNAGSSITEGGAPSNKVEGVVNLPLMDDRLAIRAALFSSQLGGYIDNVPAIHLPDPLKNPRLPSSGGIQFVPADGDPQSHEFADGSFAVPGKIYPVAYTPASNEEFVENDFNQSSYQGFRLGAKLEIDENWDLIVQHHQQTIEAEGVFDFDPEFGDLNVARFSPDTLEDTFGQTSWTLEGRLNRLDLIYTGAYLSRDVDHVFDYSEYINVGGYIPGYICEYNTPGYHGGGGVGYTYDPTLSGDPGVIECTIGTAYADVFNKNTRWTHEFRINTDLNEKVGLTAGMFFQDRLPRHSGDFVYQGTQHWPLLDVNRISTGPAFNLSERSPSTQFVNDIIRSETELAFFGELTWRINPAIEAIFGLRHYNLEIGFEGYSAFRYGSRPVPNLAGEPGVVVNPMGVGGRDYQVNLEGFQPLQVDDLISKFSLAWRALEDLLIYGTISQGYRPAGFNRAAAAGVAAPGGVAARGNDGPGGFPDYFIPVIFKSDSTDNLEVGWKSILLDRKARFNGAIYRIDWKDIQVSHFDSQNISIFTIVDNGGDALINGLEATLEYLPNSRWALSAAISYNKTELVSVNPTFDFVVADPGSQLPLTPEIQLSGRVRYEKELSRGSLYFQAAGNFAGESFNSMVDIPIVDPRLVQDAWSVLDVTVGISDIEGWVFEVFVDNLMDTRAQLHINRQDHRERITTNRPRTLGFTTRFSM